MKTETLTDWIIEIEMAAESLMGIAGAIQNGDLTGRQDQCYRTKDSLILLLSEMKRVRADAHNAQETRTSEEPVVNNGVTTTDKSKQ